jgi:hypothetical protein
MGIVWELWGGILKNLGLLGARGRDFKQRSGRPGQEFWPKRQLGLANQKNWLGK